MVATDLANLDLFIQDLPVNEIEKVPKPLIIARVCCGSSVRPCLRLRLLQPPSRARPCRQLKMVGLKCSRRS